MSPVRRFNRPKGSGHVAGPAVRHLVHAAGRLSEAGGRIEDRLKNLPQSEERDQLVKIYGKQILALTK